MYMVISLGGGDSFSVHWMMSQGLPRGPRGSPRRHGDLPMAMGKLRMAMGNSDGWFRDRIYQDWVHGGSKNKDFMKK